MRHWLIVGANEKRTRRPSCSGGFTSLQGPGPLTVIVGRSRMTNIARDT